MIFKNITRLGILTTSTIIAILPINISPVQAEVLDWQELWDCDSTVSVRTISNYNDTGIDVTIEYSGKFENDTLNLYQKEGESLICSGNREHKLWAYDGVLRITSNMEEAEPNYVKVSFSEPVYIDDVWVGNLFHRVDSWGRQRHQWMELSGYSTDNVDLNNLAASESYLVEASKIDHYESFFGVACPYTDFDEDEYGNDCNLMTDNPDFVDLIDDGSNVYKFRGQGDLDANQRGRAFGAYQSSPIQTLLFNTYTTDENGVQVHTHSSAAISPTIGFTPSSGELLYPD